MAENWRKELKTWALTSANSFTRHPGVIGTMIGGSLARGQEWQHSDLELGILVETRDPTLPYFNIVNGRGVEAIQLVQRDLSEQVAQVELGNLSPVLNWPIQLWGGRIIADPTGILARYKKQFDAHLFAPEIVSQKVSMQQGKVSKTLAAARSLLAENKPALALAQTRLAMNEAILGVHWVYHTLPRSQNRTDSRLRQLCRRHQIMPFYEVYRAVFALAETKTVIKRCWPRVKEQVLEVTRLWGGDSARDFFNYAVDGNFSWRQNAGILTVYRLYIPIIGAPDSGLSMKLDDPTWAKENQDMLQFLGLDQSAPALVSHLIDQMESAAQTYIQLPA